ncbi:NADP-dependent oxidoreductase [Dactylosporangium sp. AC04546]|uniref:NADP-dependent oxidoreductase n=1 Tax=Dactylosporangium sp. AC04546 TaxID=2862460 RepID=UPI001EDF7853|nr:NADP-dependent oxidoreductase [Dactylosporangium sp. AC04546]WVK80777.1 NADP-dependent oxidoreductase [Dactylosporangium sp. AC04546]
MEDLNTRIVLASRPSGAPTADNFAVETVPVPSPRAGEVLLRTVYLSLDPYLRGRMGSSASHSSSTSPVPIGAVMEGGTVAEVVASEDPAVRPGDIVAAATGWQRYAVAPADAVRRLDPTRAPVSTALGVLGMPGLTAYAGLLEIGRPRPTETVVVAAATGTVGATVGQLARIKGARAVGIAGGARKVAWLREAGFDAAVDHRAPDFEDQLAAATPDGVDVYFENVGGKVWRAVEPRLNRYARVPVCGVASAYSATGADSGGDIAALMSGILTRSITVQGFVYRDYEQLRPRFEEEMSAWVRSSEIIYHEEVLPGLEQAPTGLVSLLEGRHLGKLLVRV